MGGSKIEWCTDVWNPITGCSPVSEGCKNCYAGRFAQRLAGRYGYPEKNPFQITFHDDRMNEPLRWRKDRRIFLGSMTDLFHEDVTDEMRDTVFGMVAACAVLENKNHTFMVLTKRPIRMGQYFGAIGPKFHTPSDLFKRWASAADRYVQLDNPDMLASEMIWSWWYAQREQRPRATQMWPLPNLWLGVTAENQLEADTRIPILLMVPATIRFVSVEPMLESVDLSSHLRCKGCGYTKADRNLHGDHRLCKRPFNTLDWVICGAETGSGARPMEDCAAIHLRDQCVEAGVPFFFKKTSDRSRLLEGREWNEFPEI